MVENLPPGNWSSSNVAMDPISRGRRVMPKKTFQPEEIIGKLRHADVQLGRSVSRALGRALFS